MNFTKIAIIGAGNIGLSMAEGWLLSGLIQPEQLLLTRRNSVVLQPWNQRGCTISDSNKIALDADLIVLAVKPFQVLAVCRELAPDLGKVVPVVSVATGVTLQEMANALGRNEGIFRAMPNTAAAIGQSVTCIAGTQGKASVPQALVQFFEHLGVVVPIDETLMEAATVMGACGIAFALRYVRASMQAAIEIGFDSQTAGTIAAQTAKGAASLLLARQTHPETEIDKVTTPKGCTIAGLNEMEHQGFSSALIRGVVSSYKKIDNIPHS